MAVKIPEKSRGQWGSSFGFIMAAAGSAVGLGNIWRFPYITGENGGGAFVFVYILCVILIGLPLLLNEVALGKRSGKNPVGAIKSTGGNRYWQLVGILCILVCFCVLSYYSVIAGKGFPAYKFQAAQLISELPCFCFVKPHQGRMNNKIVVHGQIQCDVQ